MTSSLFPRKIRNMGQSPVPIGSPEIADAGMGPEPGRRTQTQRGSPTSNPSGRQTKMPVAREGISSRSRMAQEGFRTLSISR